jgi:hypothetical protein
MCLYARPLITSIAFHVSHTNSFYIDIHPYPSPPAAPSSDLARRLRRRRPCSADSAAGATTPLIFFFTESGLALSVYSSRSQRRQICQRRQISL